MLTLALALLISPEPAQFVFVVDTNTQVSVFVGNMRIEPGKVYQVEPFIGTIHVPITVKYVDGDVVATHTGMMTLHSGKSRQITIKVYARPPTIVTV